METATQILLLVAAAIRLATPLLLAALAGLYAERSGVIDLSLEGKMLAGAFAGAAVASVTGSVWVGALGAILTGIVLSLLHGFATVTHRGNQVVAGMAINIAMAGLIPTVAQAIFALGGQTPQLGPAQRFLNVALGNNALTFFAFLAVPATGWLLYRTGWGLRLRAVGENPYAVDTAGLPVARLRYQALLVNGALAGLAGAYLSMAANAGFSRDMTAGKGYLAIAALIFGRWAPVPTMLACLLFAFADAAQAQLQTVRILPSQFVGALPYILTVLVLALVGKGGGMPKALGIPYVKERGA
ncbi:ABC transporter permease [Roseiterribacter gracilis]|uniref:ABC transporter permease n=1 Tax=Roseiterribacter gracilis TaxID=2812848 RepID=A0A8S8XJH4_9PROT|nr:ABC transporter permease [Rhodospirillales bacterium TMPK1]